MSVPHGAPQRPAPPSPSGGTDVRRLLTFAVPGSGLLAYVLGFFDSGGAAALGGLPGLCLVGAGTLVGLTLLPGPVRFPAFTVAAPLSAFASLALLQLVVGGAASALVIVIMLLAVVQLAAVAGVVLADAGIVSLPGSPPQRAPQPPRPPMAPGPPRPGPPGGPHRPPPPAWGPPAGGPAPRPGQHPPGAFVPVAEVPQGVPAPPPHGPVTPARPDAPHPWQAGEPDRSATPRTESPNAHEDAGTADSGRSEPDARDSSRQEAPAREAARPESATADSPWQDLARSDRSAQDQSWQDPARGGPAARGGSPAPGERPDDSRSGEIESLVPKPSEHQGPPARLPYTPGNAYTPVQQPSAPQPYAAADQARPVSDQASTGGPQGTRQMPHPAASPEPPSGG